MLGDLVRPLVILPFDSDLLTSLDLDLLLSLDLVLLRSLDLDLLRSRERERFLSRERDLFLSLVLDLRFPRDLLRFLSLDRDRFLSRDLERFFSRDFLSRERDLRFSFAGSTDDDLFFSTDISFSGDATIFFLSSFFLESRSRSLVLSLSGLSLFLDRSRLDLELFPLSWDLDLVRRLRERDLLEKTNITLAHYSTDIYN